ncbi:MAG TPA: alpha/beta hydrolase [Chloroflexota bacterium]|nr:alpha/beta hydrolase [Chloroflexota bacterium]
MPHSETRVAGRSRLARDSQQWVLDYLVQETGKVFHFQGEGRGNLPRSVRSHSMISKHVGQSARRLEALARTEAEAEHPETALDLYYRAAVMFAAAQHVIFQNNDEKRYLYSGVRRCYDQVCALAPYRLEHIDIPWNGTLVSGNLHLCPGSGPRPLVFYIPGCDTMKEGWPHPQFNFAHARGMHVFSFDGPGQAECNLRGIRLTSSNYEEAASSAIDYLVERPEIDAERIGVYGVSFGSHWGLRLAARDSRVGAIAAPASTYGDKRVLMNLESPRWKQLFAYLTQSESEEELDAVAAEMTLDGYMGKITCPTLLTVGEYDPRSPIDEIFELFEQVTAPAELWLFADQHHMPNIGGTEAGTTWSAPLHGVMCDWLRDRFSGKPVAHPGEVLYLEPGGTGPNSPNVAKKRRWYE